MQPTRPTSGDDPAEKTTTGAAPTPPAPAQKSEDGGAERGVDIKVALIGATATILAAIIAGVLAVNAGAVEISLPDSGTGDDDLGATVTSLERENEELRSDNEDLQAQLDDATSTTRTTTADDNDVPTADDPAGGPEPEVNSVSLQPSQAIDLDNFRTSTVESDSLELSRLGSPNMLSSPRGYNFWPTTRDLTLGTCRALVEGDESAQEWFFWEELSDGLSFCLLTSESRIAAVTVTHKPVSFETGPLELELRVWLP